MTTIRIDPITRLEGHGRIDILLDEQGEVADAWFQVPELRGFEQFCIGRRVEDMPALTSRICGVCPEAHLLASVKALDDLFGVAPPPAGRKLRELLYSAFFVSDHTTHFYALGGPDFIVGPDAPPSQRNIFGVMGRVGPDIARQVIACRARNGEVIKLLGGRSIHPPGPYPAGGAHRSPRSPAPSSRRRPGRTSSSHCSACRSSTRSSSATRRSSTSCTPTPTGTRRTRWGRSTRRPASTSTTA